MKNENRFIPVAETYELGLVLVNSFQETRIPLFWGPGLSMSNYPAYTPPDASLWRVGEPLSIPKTVRIILGVQESYDSDAYANTDGGGSPPVPPVPPVGTPRTWRWTVDYDYGFNLSAEYLAALGVPEFVRVHRPDGSLIGRNVESDDWFSANDFPNVRVINALGGTELYSGSPLGFAGFHFHLMRTVTFISDNPPNTPLTLGGGQDIRHLQAPGPPLCWYPAYQRVPFTNHEYSFLYWGSEVPDVQNLKDFLGCSYSPPGVPPPPNVTVPPALTPPSPPISVPPPLAGP